MSRIFVLPPVLFVFPNDSFVIALGGPVSFGGAILWVMPDSRLTGGVRKEASTAKLSAPQQRPPFSRCWLVNLRGEHPGQVWYREEVRAAASQQVVPRSVAWSSRKGVTKAQLRQSFQAHVR